MSNQLPEELQQRCAEILDEDAQGVPLACSDYLMFALVTILIPAVLIVIGALL
jgi:hypothetical protein